MLVFFVVAAFFMLLSVVIVLFVMWVLSSVLRHWAKMDDDVSDDEMGIKLRESSYGSAVINGVNLNNCVRIVEHQHGYVVVPLPLFSRGKLWLDKAKIEVGPLAKRGPFSRLEVPVASDEHRIRFFGRLARFMAKAS